MAKQTAKGEAWAIFDYIVAEAAPAGVYSNPWTTDAEGQVRFAPDYPTLERLLGVPLHLKASTQSGVPALALDVWLSYELRRAGFGADQVWPRSTHPRVLSAAIPALLDWLPKKLRADIFDRIKKRSSIPGVSASSAVVLGKNYLKQVDVIITDGRTGPELLISTKRMDSSYGKNAPNRMEEAYGDAKNLRLRHPIAALGFLYGLRSDILRKEPKTAEWLFDLLYKIGQEDDAYHATCLVLMEYGEDIVLPDAGEELSPDGVPQLETGTDNAVEDEDEAESQDDDVPAAVEAAAMARIVDSLPKVTIRLDRTPAQLLPDQFLATMISRVLNATPINMHEEARRRRASHGA